MHRARMTAAIIASIGNFAATSQLDAAGPFDGMSFRERIAFSCDGNHNDPDDWAASPVALAILAEFGVAGRLVHFDYNCILPQTDPEWEAKHRESVLGAARHYEYDRSVFHDCRENVDAAVDSIAGAINASSADNPLYFVIAGPMEVPFLGIEKSDPAKRKRVYCISHSQWNDGYARRHLITHFWRNRNRREGGQPERFDWMASGAALIGGNGTR